MIQGLLFLFIFTCSISFAQTCDTIDGLIVNCIDINGNKQGYWKIQDNIIDQKIYSGLGSKEGCRSTENFHYEIKADGNYLNNNKNGLWNYYKKNDHIVVIEKTVIYKENGSTIENNLIDHTELEYNNDSSRIRGYIIHYNDTFNIENSNKKGIFKHSRLDIAISFDCPNFDQFHIEYLRLIFGYYDNYIRIEKLNKIK